MKTKITKGKMHSNTKKAKKDPFAHWLKEFETLESQESQSLEDINAQLNFLRKIPVKKTITH